MAEFTHNGSCHCGAIGFTYTSPSSPANWPIRACQCRFCRSHDARSTSEPDARIEFVSNDPQQLKRYRFALMTADFLLCRTCGVYIGAVIETEKGQFGIINIHALQPQPDNLARPAPISYDTELANRRVARREQRWSPVTGIPR